MSYPYVDRSIEPPLLVIESGDRVMPGISTLLEKRQIRPPYALRPILVERFSSRMTAEKGSAFKKD